MVLMLAGSGYIAGTRKAEAARVQDTENQVRLFAARTSALDMQCSHEATLQAISSLGACQLLSSLNGRSMDCQRIQHEREATVRAQCVSEKWQPVCYEYVNCQE